MNALAPALFQALLQSLWQLGVIGLVAAAMLALPRAASPGWRHAAAMVSLLTMLVLPILTFILCLRGDPPAPAAHALLLIDLPPAWRARLQDWAAPLWLAGAGAMLLMHGAGLVWLARVAERAAPLPAVWQARLDALRGAIGVGRAVAGRISSDVAGACTAGWRRPVIYLPASLLERLPRAGVEALLAHELAHIRRLDWVCNGIQCLAASLLFFHPAVWWLNRQIRRQRELACDAMALAAGVDPLVLAQALAQLARERAQQPLRLTGLRLALHAARGELRERVARLLGGAAGATAWKPPVLLCAGLLAWLLIGTRTDVAWPPPVPAPPPIPAPPAPPLPPIPLP